MPSWGVACSGFKLDDSRGGWGGSRELLSGIEEAHDVFTAFILYVLHSANPGICTNITSLYKYRIGGHYEEQFRKNCDAANFISLLVMERNVDEDHFLINGSRCMNRSPVGSGKVFLRGGGPPFERTKRWSSAPQKMGIFWGPRISPSTPPPPKGPLPRSAQMPCRKPKRKPRLSITKLHVMIGVHPLDGSEGIDTSSLDLGKSLVRTGKNGTAGYTKKLTSIHELSNQRYY